MEQTYGRAAATPNRFGSLVQRVLSWHNARRTRRILLEMDDRLLRDIGLTRHDVFSGDFRQRLYGRASQPALKTMLLTIIVVMGSLAAAMVAGHKPPLDAAALASCAPLTECLETIGSK